MKGGFRNVSVRIGAALLALFLMLAPAREARAQWAVTDAGLLAEEVAGWIAEIEKFGESIGLSEENLKIFKDAMDYYQKGNALLNDVNTLRYMYSSLESQMEMLKTYKQRMQELNDLGLESYYTRQLLHQCEYMYGYIQQMIQMTVKILSQTGLSLGDKLRISEEESAKIAAKSQEAQDRINSEYRVLKNMIAAKELNNLVSGTGGPVLASRVVDAKTAADQAELEAANARVDISENKGLVSRSFVIVRLVLVFLLIFMLLFVGVRYMRGDHGSEIGFVRVFVVIVVMITVLSIIMAVLKVS